MKKFALYSISAILLFAGCAKELQNPSEIGGEVQDVTFTAALNDFETKAAGEDGAGSSVNRCIMEVYYGDELFTRMYAPVNDQKKASFTLQLVSNRTYTVAFWADSVATSTTEEGLITDLYYSTSSLKAVTLKGTYAGNVDARDAFYYSGSYIVAQGGTAFDVTLKRPFAQVNVITNDVATVKKVTDLKPTDVTLTINDALTTFNVVTGAASVPADLTYTANIYKWDATNEEATLSMDYLFAAADKAVIDIDWKALKSGDSDVAHSFTNIPYQRNYRTNIKGALLTTTGKWNVTVDPEWSSGATGADDYNVYFTQVSNGSDVKGVLDSKNGDSEQDGKSASVSIDLGKGTSSVNDDVIIPDNTPKDKTPEIILDFKTLAADSQIIIRDENHDRNAANATTGAKEYEGEIIVVVPEGTTADQVKILTNKSTVTVRGEYGTVIASCAPQTIIVEAGTVIGTLNVMKGNVEIYGKVTSIVNKTAETDAAKDIVYVYLFQGSTWTNVESEKNSKLVPLYPLAKVGDDFYFSIPEAIAAVENGGIVKMVSDVTLSEKLVISNGKEFTFDLGGFTLTGRVNVSGAKVTVKNGTINAGSMAQALNAYGTDNPAYKDKVFTYINVASDVKLEGEYGMCFLSRITDGYFPYSYGVKVDFYGKSLCVSPAYVSGNIGNDQQDYSDVSSYAPDGIASRSKAMFLYGPEFNVYGELTCTGSAQENPQGITLSGMIRVNVFKGAKITGNEGIGMKSGNLHVYGGSIKSTGAKADPVQAVNSGCEASGAAISITSYYTNDVYADRAKMSVTVEGGEIIGENNSALLVTHSYSGGNAVALKQGVELSITGGTFTSGTDVPVIFIDNAATGDSFAMPSKFISGGTFNLEPNAGYIAKNCEVVKENSVWKVQPTAYSQLAETISSSPVGGNVSIYGETFTKANDGFCYKDASNKTGRLVYLTVINPGSATSNASVKISSAPASTITMQALFLGSERRLEAPGSYLKNGDVLILPDETLYLDFTSTIYDMYGDITLLGNPNGKSVIRPYQSTDKSYRFIRIYNRYKKNIEDGIIYHYNFKNVTFDGITQNAGANLFVVTCYNLQINMDNCIVKNFKGSVFSIWANDTLSDNVSYPTKADNVGVEVNLKNTECSSNGRLVHYDCSPYQVRDIDAGYDRYAFIHVNYDSTCTINNNEMYSFNTNTAKGQGNCLLNGVDVYPAD